MPQNKGTVFYMNCINIEYTISYYTVCTVNSEFIIYINYCNYVKNDILIIMIFRGKKILHQSLKVFYFCNFRSVAFLSIIKIFTISGIYSIPYRGSEILFFYFFLKKILLNPLLLHKYHCLWSTSFHGFHYFGKP